MADSTTSHVKKTRSFVLRATLVNCGILMLPPCLQFVAASHVFGCQDTHYTAFHEMYGIWRDGHRQLMRGGFYRYHWSTFVAGFLCVCVLCHRARDVNRQPCSGLDHRTSNHPPYWFTLVANYTLKQFKQLERLVPSAVDTLVVLTSPSKGFSLLRPRTIGRAVPSENSCLRRYGRALRRRGRSNRLRGIAC